jgi:simple sugar transport system permease protein
MISADFLLSVVAAAAPLLLASTGELVAERSGVLNLGIEGMMLVAAVSAFATEDITGSATLGFAAGAVAGVLMSLLFALLTLTLLANQVASGLALTIFGTGFSALVGAKFVGIALTAIPKLLFGIDAVAYASFALLAGVAWFLFRTHWGLVLRAVGDNQDAAHALGYPVVRVRFCATMFGGAMAGLAGAYMSLSYSPLWAENMTAGRGWIALALVVFSAWRPLWLVAGSYLFGLIMYLSLYVQGLGVHVPSQLVSALPYLGTIVVLVLISSDASRGRRNAPACLGRPFHAAS